MFFFATEASLLSNYGYIFKNLKESKIKIMNSKRRKPSVNKKIDY